MSLPRTESAGAEPPLLPIPGQKGGFLGWIRGMRIRQLLSVPFWLAALALLLVGDMLPALLPVQVFLQANRLGSVLTVLGVVALVLASRLGASTAAQLQALQPHRRPILYLRSFRADRNPTSTAADEELLSRIFRTAGPFVAFQEPGEWLPEIGSAKMSVKNEDWKQLVSEQIQRAQFVVLNMGRTSSFNWEVKRVLELAEPQRVLIYFSMHADYGTLYDMYERFTEIAQPLLAHPLPPVKEIGERRFIRFHADGSPELFGSIAKPGTAWRKWIGWSSFGLGLIMLRPLVIERWRQRLSGALTPLRPLLDQKISNTRLWGRLSVAAGMWLAGLAAFLPMLAWNLWHSGFKRAGAIVVASLGLLAVAPVNDTVAFFSFLLAIAVYLTWPLIMPGAARRHLALGGPSFGLVEATIVVLVAWGASMLLPQGDMEWLLTPLRENFGVLQ